MLRKQKRIDSWFLSSYGINLYRGCMHNCVYCDGRDEKYQVEGEFGRDISIKTNAIELLQRELSPERKRKPFENGFFFVCGGVSDSYQPFEKKRELTRRTLELLYRYNHPVHILTKSTLVERDMDLLRQINEQTKALVSFSFSCVDDRTGKLLEPGVPPPGKRLETIQRFKEAGFTCGMYLMPVVPLITDTRDMIEESIQKAKEVGVDFIIFGGMTLKPGRQKDYFMNFLKEHFPQYVEEYGKIYSSENPWGAPDPHYSNSINRNFDQIASKYGIPKRIPSRIFAPFVSAKELVMIILEQLDYLVQLKGQKSPYGYAAYSIAKLKDPIEKLTYDELLRIKGVGPVTAKLIQEVVRTGRCKYYESLL